MQWLPGIAKKPLASRGECVSDYVTYLWDMLPIVIGIAMLLIIRYINFTRETVDVLVQSTVDLNSMLEPLNIQKGLPILLDEISPSVSSELLAWCIVYKNKGMFVIFNKYLCEVVKSPKGSILEKVARNNTIISGKHVGNIYPKKLQFSEAGVIDAFYISVLSSSNIPPERLIFIHSQSYKLHDMLLTFGSIGGVIMQYMDTYCADAV